MSEYLDRALERMRLGVRASFVPEAFNLDTMGLAPTFLIESADSYCWGDTPSEASAAYFALCASLSVPAATSLAGPAAPIAESRSAPGAVE